MTASSRIPMPLERTFWVVVHRWAGLTIALFLMIAGVTGAVIAFEEPLSYAIRPHLSAVPAPYPGAQPLDAVTIAERVERRTGGTIRADAAGAPIADHPPETAVAVVVAALETGLGDPPRGRL